MMEPATQVITVTAGWWAVPLILLPWLVPMLAQSYGRVFVMVMGILALMVAVDLVAQPFLGLFMGLLVLVVLVSLGFGLMAGGVTQSAVIWARRRFRAGRMDWPIRGAGAVLALIVGRLVGI
jgi:hypothetical protein